jgi:hypothetical protein
MPCQLCREDGHTAKKCPNRPPPTVICEFCHVEMHHEERCEVRQRQIKDAKNLKAKIKRDADNAKKIETGIEEPSNRTAATISTSKLARKRAGDVTESMNSTRLAKKRQGDTTDVMSPERAESQREKHRTANLPPKRRDQKRSTDTTDVMSPERAASHREKNVTGNLDPARLDQKRKGDTAAVMDDMRHEKKKAGDRVDTMSQERVDRQRERKRIFGMPLEAVAKQVTKNENRNRKAGESKTGKLNFAMKRNKLPELNFDSPIVIIIFQILLSSTFHY